MGVMHILDTSGDETLEWDVEDPSSVETAKSRFETLRSQGFKAYEGVLSKGKEVTEFSADLKRLIMAPAAKPAMGGGPTSESQPTP